MFHEEREINTVVLGGLNSAARHRMEKTLFRMSQFARGKRMEYLMF